MNIGVTNHAVLAWRERGAQYANEDGKDVLFAFRMASRNDEYAPMARVDGFQYWCSAAGWFVVDATRPTPAIVTFISHEMTIKPKAVEGKPPPIDHVQAVIDKINEELERDYHEFQNQCLQKCIAKIDRKVYTATEEDRDRMLSAQAKAQSRLEANKEATRMRREQKKFLKFKERLACRQASI